jgi:hypothetical protein
LCPKSHSFLSTDFSSFGTTIGTSHRTTKCNAYDTAFLSAVNLSYFTADVISNNSPYLWSVHAAKLFTINASIFVPNSPTDKYSDIFAQCSANKKTYKSAVFLSQCRSNQSSKQPAIFSTDQISFRYPFFSTNFCT